MGKQRDWHRIIEQWSKSGLSQSAYCRQQQLSISSFNQQLRKHRAAHEATPNFIELSTGESVHIEIVVSQRVVVRLPKDVSATRLSECVRCLI